MPQKIQFQLYVLDIFSFSDIKKWEKKHSAISKYCMDHYTYLEYKRSLIHDKLVTSLVEKCKPYESSSLYRVVDYRFSNHPLSARGSTLVDPGGRFNIGDINQLRFPRFPALYLADDVATALRERCKLDPQDSGRGLTGVELNLTGNTATIKVKAKLNHVLDLTNESTLNDFFDHLKTLETPFQFITRAKRLKIPELRIIRNLKELLDTIFSDEWTVMPMNFDIPSNSQILGQIAHAGGIEAILYPSAKTKKKCLAIYLENLQTDSYVEINGDPPENVTHRKIDRDNFHTFI